MPQLHTHWEKSVHFLVFRYTLTEIHTKKKEVIFMKSSARTGAIWIGAAAAMSSIGGVCFLLIPLSPLCSNAIRCFLAAAVSLFFLKKDKISLKVNFSTLFAGICFALTTQFFSLAVPLAGAGSSTLLLNTSPFFILIFTSIAEKKIPRPQQLAAFLLTLSGIWLIVRQGGSSSSFWGIVFGLLSGICYSGIFFAAQGKDSHAPSAFFLGQLLGGICGSIFLLDAPWNRLTPFSVAALLILGIVQLGLSYRCMAKGLATAAPFTASLICSIEPILAALWAALFAHEQCSVFFVLGAALVLCGIFVQQLPTKASAHQSC